MKMKLSIASVALAVSSQAFAIAPPPGTHQPRPEPKKACVSTSTSESGAQYVGRCDQTRNNVQFHTPLLENGCASGQALFTSYTIQLPACLDPRIVQL